MSFTEEEIKEGLNYWVKKGILVKKVIKGIEYWKESKKGKELREKGLLDEKANSEGINS